MSGRTVATMLSRLGPIIVAVVAGGAAAGIGLESAAASPVETVRSSGFEISLEGSVQNPAFSPNGTQLVVTVWRGGYNVGPADLVVVPLDGGEPWELVADGWDNVSLPGSAWSEAANAVVYSSTRDPHDEIWVVAVSGEHETRRITIHRDAVAYEPSWSPTSDEVVYEVHPIDVEGEGRIARGPVGGDDEENTAAEVFITPSTEDCRQPNWSPAGDLVVFQCTEDGGESWKLWVTDPAGGDRRALQTGGLNATDASFCPDGRTVVFSGDDGESSADVWAVGVDSDELKRLSTEPGYEGAPSCSPDGTQIAFEASDGDPDGGRTVVRVIDVADA
jgi:TolB protein